MLKGQANRLANLLSEIGVPNTRIEFNPNTKQWEVIAGDNPYRIEITRTQFYLEVCDGDQIIRMQVRQ